MSLENLPPVTKYWHDEDLMDLTLEETEKLTLLLRRKIDIVVDSYERKLFNRDRDRYIQLKTLTYRERPMRDSPF